MKFDTLAKTATRKLKKNYPEILVGIGIAGMAASMILAVKATPKAVTIIENLKMESDEDVTPKEIVKNTWRCYAPATISFIASAGCIIFADSIHIKKGAALSAVCALSENALREYKQAVVETLNEDQAKKVSEKVHEKKVRKNPPPKNSSANMCYDVITGRYFPATLADLSRAENVINRMIIDQTYVSLTALYNELGVGSTAMSDILGWNYDDGIVQFDITAQVADDGTPCLVLDYVNMPRQNFDKLW